MLQLYNADSRGVVGSGAWVCPLPDCTDATVRREINGAYTLEISVPVSGRNMNELTIGRALKAPVNESGKTQDFIIKRRRRAITGGITIYAEHQSYLYNGCIIHGQVSQPNESPRSIFNGLHSYAVPDITDIATWTYSRTSGIRVNFPSRTQPIAVMDALKRFLISAAGGELVFDGFDVEYVDAMGADNGARYQYAVNLKTLETEDILDGYASGIYPFWGRAGDASKPLTVLASNPILQFSGTFPMQTILPVDLTDRFETQPSQADLLEAAQEYAALHTPTGVPMAIRAERARILGDVPVDLGDTVTVTCTPWGLDTTTRIMALEFDALRGRVKNVELGTINPGFAGAVKNLK